MKKTMNYDGMSYNELVAEKIELEKKISKMREQDMKRAFDELLKNYSATKEEILKLYFGENTTTQTVPETHKDEIPQEETVSINIEPKEENKEENLWNHPALQAPYVSQAAKKSTADLKPEKTSVKKTEEELPSMEDLLSDVPEYKELYTPKAPVKKNNRSLPTFDELLSDDPINRILCMGNENPKGAPYRQHTRINHIDGIIPTETATGKTMVYIPKRPKPTMTA